MNLFLLGLLITVTLQQTVLKMGIQTKVTIEPSSFELYTIQIPTTIQADQDLFITTIPIIDIPSQIPILTLQGNNFSSQCIQAKNELEGVCSVNHDDLIMQGRSKFTLNISCVERCTFMLKAYLNDVITIQLAKKYKIHPEVGGKSIIELQLEVPDLSFDEISIEAELSDSKEVDKGVQMFANVGNFKALLPNQKNYQYKAIQIFKGIGIIIAKAELPKGTWIKLTIYSNPNVDITLTAQVRTESTEQLTLNKKKYCFLSSNVQKIYTLDLTSMLELLEDNDIYLIALIYSGFPEIKVSFDSSFQNLIQNYGVGGNLNYILSKTVRQLNKFTGKVFIKTVPLTQTYFEINTALISKKYIYMEEATTYITLVNPQQIQNYIYDYYYELKSGDSADQYLYFTVKLKALEGSGQYQSRICNKQSILSCVLNNSSQLNDKQYLKQVEELPGNYLVYGSLYQIFLYPQLKQCRITKRKTNSTLYLCRIHMVQYNFNKNGRMEWGLTAYSRQNSIQLSDGKPFKDMVYEDSYNFYVFSPPSSASQVTVFLTTLSGQARLVTSQMYTNPELIFIFIQGNDIKTSPANSITYPNNQLKGNIFIGVYGKSMSEYIINVVIKHNSTKHTINSLIPRVQQVFDDDDSDELAFNLNIDHDGEWVVEIIELIGDIQTQLIDKKTQKIICKYFSKCTFNATISEKFYVSVKGSYYVKFSISYYPKQSCRILSNTFPNLIQVNSNQTECVQFLITTKNLQISYSEDVIHAFGAKVAVAVTINNNSLGVMDSHYLTIPKQQLSAYCPSSNKSLTKNCVLTFKITGSNSGKSELELSVIDFAAPIPLLDGITLPFSQKIFKKQTAAYFYYYSLSNREPNVFVRSLTYQSFILSYKWVDYVNFVNATSSQSLFPTYPTTADYKTSFEISSFHRLVEFSVPLPAKGICKDCLLLLSLHAEDDYKESVFEMEVSSQQGSIQLGETVRGILDKEQSYTYSLQKIQAKQQAIISLLNYKEGSGCYEIFVTRGKGSQQKFFKGDQILISNEQQYKLFIRGVENNCKFQLFYWLVQVPIRVIYSGFRYSLNLQNSSSAYFLYFHQANTSFRVFQGVRSGYIVSHATPVNQSLHQVIKKGDFLFGTESIYDDIEIFPNSTNFCFNCHYLIKVTAEPTAKGAIGVTDPLSSVQLMADEVVREKVTNETRQYEYYSNSIFKIKVSVVFGSLNIEIKDMSDAWIYSGTATPQFGDNQISVNASNSDSMSGYQIKLTIKESATYSIQIIEDSNIRLIEGYPISHTFHKDQSIPFAYSHSSKQKFNLALIIDQSLYQSLSIDLSLSMDSKEGVKNMTITGSQVGNIYSYDIPGQSAEYTIKVTTNMIVRIKLLVARNKLTYLQPGVASLSNDSTIYQLFTGGLPIMVQLFACKGDAQLTASSKYSKVQQLQSSDTISLQHSNTGGHYVIESRSVEREYYALVRSRSQQPPLYMISYTTIKALPYGYFDTIERSLQYKLGKNQLELSFQLPALLNLKLTEVNRQFVLMVAQKGSDFNSLAQCRMGNSLLTLKKVINNFPLLETIVFKFNVTRQELATLLKQDVDTYFMGIILSISFKQDNISRKLTYIYEALEISLAFPNLTAETDSSLTSFIIFWVVLPILVGVAIAWYSLKFCLHRLRKLSQPNNELMEEPDTKEEYSSHQREQDTATKKEGSNMKKQQGSDFHLGLNSFKQT